ncbi:MAG: redoxin domain-containing protein [Planctomycetes bacterium]|nr:redoxin domain-containing protein [Planctomycetota bacterium]
MTTAVWRLAASLVLLSLAACRSGGGDAPEQPTAAGELVQRSQPGAAEQPAQAAEPAMPVEIVRIQRPTAGPERVAPPAAKAALGELAPDFTLTDLDGQTHRLADYRGKTVVLEWFNPTCPYCVHAYSAGPLVELPNRLKAEGVVWLAVNSQNPKHPGSQPARNRAFVEQHGLKSPILMDPEGLVGRAYGAKTTPHCFVIDPRGVLAYAGGLDNAPNGKVEGEGPRLDHVAAAVADVQAGRPVAVKTSRAYG